jgi:vancomycin resistance protein YoaR
VFKKTQIFLIVSLIFLGFSIVEVRAEVVSEYHSSFKDGNKNRIFNITRASISIDGTVIPPGKTFSFNGTAGPISEAGGYKKARIFINGKDAQGFGGGVCQVSSTLYGAALDAGLTVIERHPHSKEVGYVPKNREAAVSYGGVDLKLRNDFNYPVKIDSYIYDEQIFVAIVK